MLLRLLDMRPYRCHCCFQRQYRFVTGRKPSRTPARAFARRTRWFWQPAALLLLLAGIPILAAHPAPVARAFESLESAALPARDGGGANPSRRPSEATRLAPADLGTALPRHAVASVAYALPADSAPAAKVQDAAPAAAAPAHDPDPQREALGPLRATGEVYVNELKVVDELTAYYGDKVVTGVNGGAILSVPGRGTLALAQQTELTIAPAPSGPYLVTLTKGSASFRSFGGTKEFAIGVVGFAITPEPKGDNGGDVDFLPDGSVHVKCTLGSMGVIALEGPQSGFISAGQEVVILPDGTLHTTAPPGQQQPEPSGPTAEQHKGKGPWVAVGIVAGAGGVAAAVIASRGGASPASPSAP